MTDYREKAIRFIELVQDCTREQAEQMLDDWEYAEFNFRNLPDVLRQLDEEAEEDVNG